MTHWFELKTASVTYYIGVADELQYELGAQWESAIRQAWMPVTPQSSTGSGGGQLRGIGSLTFLKIFIYEKFFPKF